MTKLRTNKSFHFVTDAELALAVRVGRTMGAPQHLCALALKTAYQCVKRSVEVRALAREQIRPEGIAWTAAKRKGRQAAQVGSVRVAQAGGIALERFSLQDCRPKGVTDKLSSGQSDVMDATLYTKSKMIQTVYNRRRTRTAKPVLCMRDVEKCLWAP